MNAHEKIILLVGYISSSLAVFSATSSQVTGFELSIYQSTPTGFWIFALLSMLSFVYILLSTDEEVGIPFALPGLLLSIALFGLLPLLRGYAYVGTGDPLTHLGWVRDILSSRASPVSSELLYPHYLLFASLLSYVIDYTPKMALLLSVVPFLVLSILSISLAVREFTGEQTGIIWGAIIGVLLTPINLQATAIMPHPASIAVMFSPIFVYLFIRYWVREDVRFTIPFLISGISLILLHPRQALAVFSAFFTYPLLLKATPIRRNRNLREVLPVVIILSALLFFWVSSKENFARTLVTLVSTFTHSQAGTEAAGYYSQTQRSIITIILYGLKLYLIPFILCLISFLFLSKTLYFRIQGETRTPVEIATLFLAGLIPVTIQFFIFLLTTYKEFWRIQAIIMVIVTIIAASAIVQNQKWEAVDQHTIFCIVAVAILICSMVYFPSPYIFRSSSHVPSSTINGFDTAFEYQQEDDEIAGIGAPVFRYREAIYGRSSRYGEGMLPSHNKVLYITGPFYTTQLMPAEISNKTQTDTYQIAVTQQDVEIQTKIYGGRVYSRGFLKSLEGCLRVIDAGTMRIYQPSPNCGR